MIAIKRNNPPVKEGCILGGTVVPSAHVKGTASVARCSQIGKRKPAAGVPAPDGRRKNLALHPPSSKPLRDPADENAKRLGEAATGKLSPAWGVGVSSGAKPTVTIPRHQKFAAPVNSGVLCLLALLPGIKEKGIGER